MNRVEMLPGPGNGRMVHFVCPGCGHTHCLPVRPTDPAAGPTPSWEFNENCEFPTLYPSILSRWNNTRGPRVCHSYVTAGKIQFLDDCTHELSGQTVYLPECPPL